MITVLIYWWALYAWQVECYKEPFACMSCFELALELFYLVMWWNDRR